MNAGNWIELAALLVTVIGGGGLTALKLVTRLTRIAVAVEQGTHAIKKVVTKVDDHERRLNRGGL